MTMNGGRAPPHYPVEPLILRVLDDPTRYFPISQLGSAARLESASREALCKSRATRPRDWRMGVIVEDRATPTKRGSCAGSYGPTRVRQFALLGRQLGRRERLDQRLLHFGPRTTTMVWMKHPNYEADDEDDLVDERGVVRDGGVVHVPLYMIELDATRFGGSKPNAALASPRFGHA